MPHVGINISEGAHRQPRNSYNMLRPTANIIICHVKHHLYKYTQNKSANYTEVISTSRSSKSRFKDNTVLIRRSLCSFCIAFSCAFCSLVLQTAQTDQKVQFKLKSNITDTDT